MRGRPLSRKYTEDRIRGLIQFAVSNQSRRDTVQCFLNRESTRAMCERALHSLGLAHFFLAAFALFAALSLSAQSSYVVYQDTENGTSGNMITTTMLANSTFTNGLFGTWTINPSPHTRFYLTNVSDSPLRAPHLVGGTYFTGAGHANTYCVKANGTVDDYCRFDLASSGRIGQFAIGWYWTFSPTASLGDFVDALHINLVGGDYAVMAFRDDSSPKAVRIHTNAGASVGPDILVTSNTTYWCTILVDTNNGAQGMAKLALYDPTTWRMVGNPSTLAFAVKGMVEYWKFGCLNSHTVNANFRMFYDDFLIETGPNAVSNWPLRPAGATVIASSTSRTAFDQAYTNATSAAGTNFDTISLPTGSNLWASTYTIGKRIGIRGSGTNFNQTVVNFDATLQTDDGFYFNSSAGGSRMSDLCVRAKLYSTNTVRLIHVDNANECVFTNLYLHSAYWGVYNEGRNVYRWLNVVNCNKAVRNHGWLQDNTMWSTYYPVPNESTNRAFYEDCIFSVDSGAINSGARNMCSSQEAAIWAFRHCTFNVSAYDWSPVLDSHGDDQSVNFRSVLSDQVYKCAFNISGTATVNGDLFDKRGGRGLFFSNTVSGLSVTVRLREERESDVPMDGVEDFWFWENSNTSVTVPVANQDVIQQDVQYFLNGPTGYSVQNYPHFLTTGGVPGTQALPPAAPANAITLIRGGAGQSSGNRTRGAVARSGG